MSATGRNKEENERDENDYYPTPRWVVHRFLEKVELPCGGYWLEPTAGDGSIVRAVKTHKGVPFYNTPNLWKLIELQPEFESLLCKEADYVVINDFLKSHYLKDRTGLSIIADVCIGNPPYALALPIIQHAMTQANVVCMLLRLNFLACGKRVAWMQENTPDIYVIPNRPSFRGKGSDATEYAWFVWSHGEKHGNGKVEILDPTPKEERLRDKKESIKIIEEYKKLMTNSDTSTVDCDTSHNC